MSSKENLGHRIGSPVDGYTTMRDSAQEIISRLS